jgi:hypothetical protein
MALGAIAAMAAPYLLNAGAGYLGNKSRKTTPGQAGGWQVAPQYSFTEPRRRLMSDFVSDNITRAGRGEAPAYFDRAEPMMRRGLERGVQNTYFGRPGDRTGSVQGALEAGALAGTGSRPGTANVNKALQRYEEAGLGIEEFISKERMRSTEDSVKMSLYASNQMAAGPAAQYVSGQGPQTSEGSMPWLSEIAGMMGQNAPAISDAIGGLFGGGGASGGWEGGDIYKPGYQLPGEGNMPGGVAPADYYLNQTSASIAPQEGGPFDFYGEAMKNVQPWLFDPIGAGGRAGVQAGQDFTKDRNIWEAIQGMIRGYMGGNNNAS